jgi:hypothetical protein
MPAPTTPPRAAPEGTTPDPVLPERSTGPATATAPPAARPSVPQTARRAREPETPAAMPQRARADVRVDVSTAKLGDGITSYTVRLRERDGAPVTDAAVAIRGRRKDGALVEAELDPTTEPGVYRAAIRAGEVRDPRLRVASAGRIQDLPLAE